MSGDKNVIPGKGGNWISTGLDLFVISLVAAKERTESDWRTLLESVVLKITRILSYEKGSESLIEAELV